MSEERSIMVDAHLASQKDRVAILAASICIIVGGVAFFYGEWSVGIGTPAVVNRLISYCGVALIGVAAVAIAIVFAKNLILRFVGETSAARRELLRALGRQSLAAFLNIVVYGGMLVLLLGCVSALDSASVGTVVVVAVVAMLCILSFFAYRRYRKKHRSKYDLIGNIGMILFMMVLGVGMLIGFALNAQGAVKDLVEGPKTADVFLVDASIDHPSRRYRFAVQDHHVLTFYTADEERIVLEVPEADIESAKTINELGNFVHLMYYPNSQVFVSATRWQDGRQEMGEDLLDKLHDAYDFIL